MVTKFPRIDLARSRVPVPPRERTPQVEGLGERVLERVHELICGLQGHDVLLQFDHDRLFLRCVSCGHESPGWNLTEAPPRPTAQVDKPRAAEPLPHLVRERRIA